MYKEDILSIVIAAYNSEATIKACLDSIKQQNSHQYQLLIVDGSSKDQTISIIKEYSKIIDKFISEPDDGVYDAWNKALEFCRGEWVMFLGTDDAFVSQDAVETVLSAAKGKSLSYDFIYLKVAMLENLEDASTVIEIMGEEEPDKYTQALPKEMLFSHTGSLHKVSLFQELGNFNAKFKVSADYEFVLRAYLANGKPIGKIDELLIYMSTGGLSTAINTRITGCKECITIRKMHGQGKLSLFLRIRILKIYFGLCVKSLFGDKAFLKLVNFYRVCVGKPKRSVYQ